MKILYFHQHFSTPRGAAGTRSYEMARHLVRRGHLVTIVCGSTETGRSGLEGGYVRGVRRGYVDGIEIIEFDLRYSNKLSFISRIGRFLSFSLRSTLTAFTESYDVVFATTTPLTAAIPGIVARWFKRKPFVFEVRDLWPELPREMGVIKNPMLLGLMSGLEWLSYHSANKLIGLSPGIVEGIRKRGISGDRIELVPNGCDLEIFNTSCVPWRPAGVSEHDLMAIYTGTHGIANGLFSIVDVAKELKRRGREDIKFVLVGDGMQKVQLQEKVKCEGLGNVVFHKPIAKLELAALLASADLGMQILANVPAFYNGTSPNKFFDYLAAGLPILNNYPGWLAELIIRYKCGYVVEPDNPAAFADVLEYVSVHREELVEKRRHARELAQTEFDRTILAERFTECIEGAYR